MSVGFSLVLSSNLIDGWFLVLRNFPEAEWGLAFSHQLHTQKSKISGELGNHLDFLFPENLQFSRILKIFNFHETGGKFLTF